MVDKLKLLSFPSLVLAPFIIVTIGGYTFGNVSKKKSSSLTLNVTFPDLVDRMTVVKLNGQLNSYTISLTYAITPGRDPNAIDRILGHEAMTREIKISYGDWQSPNLVFKEETAIILNVKTDINFSASQIKYTITCLSSALLLTSQSFNFPGVTAKPSDVIKRMLYDLKYGLTDVFPGFVDKQNMTELIAGDDMCVTIPPRPQTNTLDYIKYLVNSMVPASSGISGGLSSSVYKLSIVDDNKNKYNGSYFKILKIARASLQNLSGDGSYEIDIGYPGDNYVTGFSLKDDENWAILYKNLENVPQQQYQYRINNRGEVIRNNTPAITRSSALLTTTPADTTWWTLMTLFPIGATLLLKGLVRPTILMNYIKINVVFYGLPHIASGIYFINKQTDTINGDGYSTTLDLIRLPETNL